MSASLLASWLGPTVSGQSKAPQSQAEQLQQALTARIDQLGACHAELGSYQQQIANGQLVTWAQVKAAIEQANPGKTLGPDLALVEKPTLQK